MDTFYRICAGVLIASLLVITLQKQEKDISILLICLVCCMIMAAAVSFLTPILDFLQQLKSIAQLDSEAVSILFKAVGIGLVGELTNAICADSGNSALGKALQILTTVVILWISLPLFSALIDLVEGVLNGI